MPTDFLLDGYRGFLAQRDLSAESVGHYLADAEVIISFLRQYHLVSNEVTESALMTFLVNIERLDVPPIKQRQYYKSAQMMIEFINTPAPNDSNTAGKSVLHAFLSI